MGCRSGIAHVVGVPTIALPLSAQKGRGAPAMNQAARSMRPRRPYTEFPPPLEVAALSQRSDTSKACLKFLAVAGQIFVTRAL